MFQLKLLKLFKKYFVYFEDQIYWCFTLRLYECMYRSAGLCIETNI